MIYVVTSGGSGRDNQPGAAPALRPLRPWPDHFFRWNKFFYEAQEKWLALLDMLKVINICTLLFVVLRCSCLHKHMVLYSPGSKSDGFLRGSSC